MLRGWEAGWPWDVCGRMGALAATYCLECNGPQNHTFTVAEFVARYRQHFDDGGLLDGLLNHASSDGRDQANVIRSQHRRQLGVPRLTSGPRS